VASYAVLVEDGLYVCGVVQYPCGGFVAGLGLGFRGRMQKGHRLSAALARGVVGLLVASDTGARFAGAIIYVGPLSLDFEVVFIEGLEVDVLVGRDEEVCRAVLEHGDYSVHYL